MDYLRDISTCYAVGTDYIVGALAPRSDAYTVLGPEGRGACISIHIQLADCLGNTVSQVDRLGMDGGRHLRGA